MVRKTKKDTDRETTRLEERPAAELGDKENGGDLMKRLEDAERKAVENYDKYLRVMAELDNYKKRAAKEKTDAIAYGNENLIKDILPILDSLDRAAEHACNAGDMAAFKEGFRLVKEQLLCCLEKHGVEKIEAVGADFNPNLHDALLQVESEGHGNNKVIEEFEKGYLLKGRLLKPTKVSVGRAAKKDN
ncbi:MAG: nucleotide exchange factor GrpE [Syntrophobacteraceae bacterium CG23_combo_of_CG06-09_8_20_14_all_50_8]|nr:MAG: nucleotide exchange factor GrpE [Syntrophobacteraceae bacterium CG23_combo_of_CG06-09_8_20_14_all_50_8]